MSIETAQDPDAFTEFEQQGREVVCHDYAYWFLPLTRQSVAPLLETARADASCRLLAVQSTRARGETYASVRDGLLAFSEAGDGYRIPMPALIGSAQRP